MEKLRAEIKRIKRHNLDYYQSHLDLVEHYIVEKPDISIEACKALVEGISKLSLFLLDKKPITDNRDDFGPLFRAALIQLQRGRGYFDDKFISKLTGVINHIGDVRNHHCDIGHGRASLKEQVNDEDFADLIIGVTDNVCTYMLRRLDKQAEKELLYDDNPNFNDFLDEKYPIPNSKIRYSKALFDQEHETYKISLEDYLVSLEEESNEH